MLNNKFWSIISCCLLLTCVFSCKGVEDHTDADVQFMLGTMVPETYDILKGKWESGYVSYTNKVWVL